MTELSSRACVNELVACRKVKDAFQDDSVCTTSLAQFCDRDALCRVGRQVFQDLKVHQKSNYRCRHHLRIQIDCMSLSRSRMTLLREWKYRHLLNDQN